MKRYLIIIITIIMILGVNAHAEEHNEYAEKLSKLGVFKGTETGFELDREPTRLEGLIMFIRLLGKEEEALLGGANHPFIDVPPWADNYVGWAYENGYTSGISATEFGQGNIKAKSYLTFILRALGYDDSNGDFDWSGAIDFANTIELIDADMKQILISDIFLREHVAKISYDALNTKTRDNQTNLSKELVTKGVFEQSTIDEIVGIETQLLDKIPGVYFMKGIFEKKAYIYPDEVLEVYPNATSWMVGGYIGDFNLDYHIDSYNKRKESATVYDIYKGTTMGLDGYEQVLIQIFDSNKNIIACALYDPTLVENSFEHLVQVRITHEKVSIWTTYDETHSVMGNTEEFPHVLHIERYIGGIIDERFVCTGGSYHGNGDLTGGDVGYFVKLTDDTEYVVTSDIIDVYSSEQINAD